MFACFSCQALNTMLILGALGNCRMQLNSLYDYFQRKYKSTSDVDLRKRLLSFPEYQLLRLADHTMVVENAASGLKVLQLRDISGLTFTTATDTLAIARESDPITVARYFEEKGKKLEHPELPMLAVRKDLHPDACLHYDFVSTEFCLLVFNSFLSSRWSKCSIERRSAWRPSRSAAMTRRLTTTPSSRSCFSSSLTSRRSKKV